MGMVKTTRQIPTQEISDGLATRPHQAGVRRQTKHAHDVFIANSFKVRQVIETETSNLGAAEQRLHRAECEKGMLKELLSGHGLKAWEVVNREGARNIIDSKRVVEWKRISGVKGIKSRLVVRGF